MALGQSLNCFGTDSLNGEKDNGNTSASWSNSGRTITISIQSKLLITINLEKSFKVLSRQLTTSTNQTIDWTTYKPVSEEQTTRTFPKAFTWQPSEVQNNSCHTSLELLVTLVSLLQLHHHFPPPSPPPPLHHPEKSKVRLRNARAKIHKFNLLSVDDGCSTDFYRRNGCTYKSNNKVHYNNNNNYYSYSTPMPWSDRPSPRSPPTLLQLKEWRPFWELQTVPKCCHRNRDGKCHENISQTDNIFLTSDHAHSYRNSFMTSLRARRLGFQVGGTLQWLSTDLGRNPIIIFITVIVTVAKTLHHCRHRCHLQEKIKRLMRAVIMPIMMSVLRSSTLAGIWSWCQPDNEMKKGREEKGERKTESEEKNAKKRGADWCVRCWKMKRSHEHN